MESKTSGYSLRVLQVGVALIMLWPMGSAIKRFSVEATFVDEPKLVLDFLREKWQPGDRLYATKLATACVLYYKAGEDSERILSLTPESMAGDPQKGKDPFHIKSGRNWFVEMRTPWETRGESILVRAFFESKGNAKLQKDVQWSSATLFEIDNVQ